MFARTSGQVAVLIFFSSIVLSSEDFLEYYQPRPSFPKELNDWLAYVQTHRNDFRVIRNIVKRRKEEDYDDERESDDKILTDIDAFDEDVPQNDIYPRSNREKKEKSYTKPQKLQNPAKKRLNNPTRTRRDSNENNFFEHHNIEIDPRSSNGEIKRAENKYPDQFVNRPKEDMIKRDVQIDILSDGKLVKSIRENDKQPKSIMLNIQDADQAKRPLVEETPDSKSFDSPPIPMYAPPRSIDPVTPQPNIKELDSNYRNLFTVNENLNTDSSMARDALAKTALMYHVTLPDPNFIVQHDTNNYSRNDYSFQKNNFKDMSKYWTASEKNQLQQGIQFAHATGNLRKLQQQQNAQKAFDRDGFETARTIIVDKAANKLPPDDSEEVIHKPQSKRNLQALDGKVQLQSVPESSLFNPAKIQDLPFEQFPMKNSITDIRQVSVVRDSTTSSINPAENLDRINNLAQRNLNSDLCDDQDQSNRPSLPKIDENINNHIAITIIEPRKDEDPEEEVRIPEMSVNNDDSKSCSPISTDVTTEAERPGVLNENENRNNPGESCESGQCRQDDQAMRMMDLPTDNANGNNQDIPCDNQVEGATVKNQVNNIRVHIEPRHGKSPSQVFIDDKNYFPEKSDAATVREPIANDRVANNADKYCTGPNCSPRTRISRNKYKRKRKRKRRRHHDYSTDNQQPFKSRQLKVAEYVYDADLEGPDSEYIAGPMSSERATVDKKKSVEGDYGDEEDSLASKRNTSSKLLKESDNIFANPHTTTDPDDDEDYYDETNEQIEYFKKDEGKPEQKFRDDDKSSLGQRLHKKGKVPVKKPNRQRENSKGAIRDPRSSDASLQQLPRFVINDQINEENLRKRSLANQKEAVQKNKFPLSAKSFFASNNPKRRESGDTEILVDKPSVAPQPEKGSTQDDSLNAGDFLSNTGGTGGTDDGHGGDDLGDSTTGTTVTEECETNAVSIGLACASDNFTKIRLPMTTMLNLVADAPNNDNDSVPALNEQYQNLEEILIGKLPLSIVDSVFKNIKSHPTIKQRFFKGMSKKHKPVTFQKLPDISNRESLKLVNLMSKIMNRLQWTTTCQILPGKLKRYLLAITQTKNEDRLSKTKEMEEIDVEESQNQTSFIFHSNNGVDNIEDKVRILKMMLNKYQHLPETCKPRAEPVKEYIENHLDMLTHVMSNSMERSRPRKSNLAEEPKEQIIAKINEDSARKEDKSNNPDLIERELESLGLGQHPNFKFDFNTLLHKEQGSEAQKPKKTKKRDSNRLKRETSEQYERLLEAVKRERTKREGRKRIAQAFGKLSIEDYNGETNDNTINEVFESPLVYSF